MEALQLHIHKVGWIVLVFGLFLTTFGVWWTCFLLLYALLFVFGFVMVLSYWGYLMSQEMRKSTLEGDFGPMSKGLGKVIHEIQLSRIALKMDKRLTGSNIIDEPLQEIIWRMYEVIAPNL